MFRQFSFIRIFSVCHGITVVTVSGIVVVSRSAYVRLCIVVLGCCDLGLINNIRSKAVAVNWA